ncbi:MAG: alpha/beta hydrolase [Chloroflexaceae bacterium]|nr:alpha/beta hydrolase [Chloroflexaceae bacterium]
MKAPKISVVKSLQQRSFLPKRLAVSLLSSLLPVFLGAIPVPAAERVFFNYGPLDFSISVEDLANFAKTGEISRELNFYLRRVAPEKQELFRQALQKEYELPTVQIWRFFNTPMGEELLSRIGLGITFEDGRNGMFGLRAAVVQASLEPGGASLLKVLQKFPTNIRLNTNNLLKEAAIVEQTVNTTEAMRVEIKRLSAQAIAAETPTDFSAVTDLRQPGQNGVQQQTLTLNDSKRDRN